MLIQETLPTWNRYHSMQLSTTTEGRNLGTRPGPSAAAEPGEALRSFTHCYSHVTHPPGQLAEDSSSVGVVSRRRGTRIMQVDQIRSERTTPDWARPQPKTQFTELKSKQLRKYDLTSPCRSVWWHVHVD